MKAATLSHHNLKVYQLARGLVRLAHRHRLKNAELRGQAQRASVSVALNVAEGAGLDGRACSRHFRIAKASAIETLAAYEVASDIGEIVALDEVTERVRSIAAMLTALAR